jgi:hypothetical protein
MAGAGALVVALALSVLLLPPAAKTRCFGEFGYQRLMSLDRRVAWINEKSETGYWYNYHCGGQFIPFSGEWFTFNSGPTNIAHHRDRSDGQLLEPDADGRYRFESAAQPIELVFEQEDRPDSDLVRVWVRAETIK